MYRGGVTAHQHQKQKKNKKKNNFFFVGGGGLLCVSMIVEKEMMNDARHNCQKRQDENGDQGNHPRIH